MPILVLEIAHKKFLTVTFYAWKCSNSIWSSAATTCWLMANQKRSKHGFHWYMICHDLERHGGQTELSKLPPQSGSSLEAVGPNP